MSREVNSQTSSRFLEELADLSTLTRTTESLMRLDVLLTDYLVCLVGAMKGPSRSDNLLAKDGLIGQSAWLAMTSNGDDQDDIDWTVGVHPGSIIWSTAIALGLRDEKVRENFISAVIAGYRTFTSVAKVFGPTHRSKWHVTATAGSFASATTASVLFGLSQAEHVKALHLAGANIGGSVLAPRDRSGAGGFNRAAATSLGVTAALSIQSGAQPVMDLWDGPSGVLELFDSSGNFSEDNELADGVSTTSLRLFPVTGFAQAAVLASSSLSRRTTGTLRRLDVGVSGGAISFLDGTRGGEWWDARSAVARAWLSQDPTHLPRNLGYEETKKLVHISSIEIPIGGACVIATTDAGEEREVVSSSPGRNFDQAQEIQWREAKWTRLAGNGLEDVKEISTNLIIENNSFEVWNKINQVLLNTSGA
jgi:hypothetical protein